MIFRPENLPLYRAMEKAILESCPGAEIREAKTQVGFFHGCGFAWVSEKGKKFIVSIGLPRRLEGPRLYHGVEAYPGRWTNHIIINGENEIDGELLDWIADAHEFAVERGVKRGRI